MRIAVKPYWSRNDGYVGTTIALITAAAAVAGAATSAVGAYSSSQAQKSAAEFNQKVATNNAQAHAQQAQADASRVRTRNLRLLGSQQAAFAKAGIAGGGDVEYDSAVQGEMDALTTMYKGRIESGADTSAGQLYGAQASNSETAGYFSAGGTMLSGVGTAALTYSSIRNRTPDWG